MSYVNPIWLEGQRRRWQRHDWHRFIRHDAHRFMTPAGIAEEQRAAEAEKAARRKAETAAAAEQDAFEREVLALRHEFAKLKLEYELRRFQQKYSPDQPRVPAGSSEGGQWTSGDGGTGARLPDVGDTSAPAGLVLSDASPDPIKPGTQLANVIRVCMAGIRSISSDQWGNTRNWWVEYTCADGFSFRQYGVGGKIKAFITDPRY